MTIRIITAADLDTFWPVILDAYPGLASKLDAAGIFHSDNPFVIIGDPDVPILVRLERLRVDGPASFAILPPALRTAVRNAGGVCVQVTDFYPLPIREPGGATKVAAALKLLASVLREGARRHPALRQVPVFANFDVQLVGFMKNGVPAAGIPAPFPNAGASGTFIWHTQLEDARLAVDTLAVDLP